LTPSIKCRFDNQSYEDGEGEIFLLAEPSDEAA
jgi:hypothetical protein